MSNKFWAAGSDSESESSDASSSGSDDDRQMGGRATGRFQMSDSSSGMFTGLIIFYLRCTAGRSGALGRRIKSDPGSLAALL